MTENKITGIHIYYYFVCHRKLWYFANELSFEDENENVRIGKIIDDTAYKAQKKHIMIDNTINIDYISEHRLLHEVKKSRKVEEAGIWQIKYYLYYLKKRGAEGLSGKIDYPLLKQSINIELCEADEVYIEKIIDEIKSIVSLPIAPSEDKKDFCKSCAYYEFCMI